MENSSKRVESEALNLAEQLSVKPRLTNTETGHGYLSSRMCERVLQVMTVFTSRMTRGGRSHGVNSHLQTVMCCSLAPTETGRAEHYDAGYSQVKCN